MKHMINLTIKLYALLGIRGITIQLFLVLRILRHVHVGVHNRGVPQQK